MTVPAEWEAARCATLDRELAPVKNGTKFGTLLPAVAALPRARPLAPETLWSWTFQWTSRATWRGSS